MPWLALLLVVLLAVALRHDASVNDGVSWWLTVADRVPGARNRPDLILVERRLGIDWDAWIKSYAPLAAALRLYRKVRSLDGFDILRRDADAS